MRHTRTIVTHYGGPDALQVVEEERPEPKDGEVRRSAAKSDIAAFELRLSTNKKPLGFTVFNPTYELRGERSCSPGAGPQPPSPHTSFEDRQ